MSFRRAFEDTDPVGRRDRSLRQDARSGLLAVGTLACPRCDAPVSPGPRPLSPAEPIACPVCLTAGPVRTFLSLATPTRPARVNVRLVQRYPSRP